VDPNVGLPVVHGLPDADVLRAAISVKGSLLVRGLLPKPVTERLHGIARQSLSARDRYIGSEPGSEFYAEFPRLREGMSRVFTRPEGMLAVDSPRGLLELIDTFRDVGLRRLAEDYLGAAPALAAEKTVFREVHARTDNQRAELENFGWHQDGAFLGERIRALDVWIALTPCGRIAPGLEVVAHRFDDLIPPGGKSDWDLSAQRIQAALPGARTAIPEFEPGDAILFDHLCVHRTAYLPRMTETRLAIECWLFAAGTFPPNYAGLML
jgi:hypothetical protein